MFVMFSIDTLISPVSAWFPCHSQPPRPPVSLEKNGRRRRRSRATNNPMSCLQPPAFTSFFHLILIIAAALAHQAQAEDQTNKASAATFGSRPKSTNGAVQIRSTTNFLQAARSPRTNDTDALLIAPPAKSLQEKSPSVDGAAVLQQTSAESVAARMDRYERMNGTKLFHFYDQGGRAVDFFKASIDLAAISLGRVSRRETAAARFP